MREITLDEQKKILIEILKYIDDVCKENNIKYSLIGGSLIGAIRNKGIIPWDDDVDIILLNNEYDKLIECLKKSDNSRYRLMTVDTEKTYYYPFAKIVDTSTILTENIFKKINGMGVYVDIFKYNYIPDNNKELRKYCKKIKFLKRILTYSCTIKSNSRIKNFIYKYISKINSNKLAKRIITYEEKYNNKKSKYLLSNWTVYALEKEIQKSNNFDEYEYVEFENINAMVTKKFDEVLKTTFGDYMTPPPAEKRISHHYTSAYWKD